MVHGAAIEFQYSLMQSDVDLFQILETEDYMVETLPILPFNIQLCSKR